MPSFATERRDPVGESQLEILLRELLDKDTSVHHSGVEAPREIAELRDAARRLRAASQWMPLPEGRLAVRRALLATADQAHRYAAGRAPWRRAGLWLSMAAVAAVVVGAFGLGAGALNALVPPTSPVYSLRLVLDQARGVFLPGHPNPGQYALGYQFPAVQLPAAGGVTRTANGKIGGLPTTLTLTAAETCGTGGRCGRFVVSLAGLSTPASAKFGELKGTFACASDGCTLALAKATGVFAQVSTPHMPVSAARATEGRLTVKMASRGDWVAAVATAAYALQTDGMLPEGVTTSDLVGKAAADDQTTGGGGPNGRVEKNAPNSVAGKVANDETGTGGSGRTRIWMTAPTPRVSTPTSTGVAGGATSGAGGKIGPNGQGSGSNGSGGSTSSNGSTVGGGATISDDASTGNGGVGVGGGTTVDAGTSSGSGGVGVGGGASVDAGASTGSGGVNVGGGASVDAGASTGSGGVNVGGGASVDAGASTNNGGVGAGGGANVNAGGSAGSGGSTAGGGANVNAGASAGSGGSTAGGGANVNAGGGGVNVNGGINVNGGGVNVNGGVGGTTGGSGGGASGGSSGAGSGSH